MEIIRIIKPDFVLPLGRLCKCALVLSAREAIFTGMSLFLGKGII